MTGRTHLPNKGRLALLALGLAAMVLFLMTSPAQAQDLKYVDIGVAASGDGSAATPWKHLFEALDPATGITDDTILYVAAGTYSVANGEPAGTREISKNNVVLAGMGAGVTILEGTPGHSWSTGLIITGDNVSVRNVTITNFQDGLAVNSVNTCEISDNEIFDNGEVVSGHAGIVVTNSDNVSIHNNSIYWTGDANHKQTDGIRAVDNLAPYDDDIYVADNTIRDHNQDGSSGVKITDCYAVMRYNDILGNDTGVIVETVAPFGWITPQIERCYFTGNKTAINIATNAGTSGASPIIFNNQINDDGSNTTERGIYLNSSGGAAIGGTIEINTIADLTGNGLELSNDINPAINIFGNIIAFCDDYGVQWNMTGTLSQMTSNNVYGNGLADIINVTPGSGNISLDPQFAGTTDYHLKWNSPCLDQISIPGITEDLVGTGRPAGPPPTPLSDMGCYETPWHSISTSVTPAGSGTVIAPSGGYYKETVNVLASPNIGFTFVEWQGDLTTTNPSETLLMDDNKTIQAVFSAGPTSYTLTTAVAPTGAGTVLGGGSYAEGATATLQAVPNSGWFFRDWSGDVTGTGNPTTVVMDSNKTVTANFLADAGYTVNFTGSRSAEAYRIVPVAAEHPYGLAANVLGLPGGSYDRTSMRIGCWDPGTQSYLEYPFGSLQIKPGWAGWFLFADNATLKVNGTDVPLSPAPPAIGGDPGIIMPNLAEGWNQIGNPFRNAIYTSNIYMMTPVPQPVVFYVYEGGVYYIATGGLPVDQGGWFYNDSGGPVDVFIQSTAYTLDPAGARLAASGLVELTEDDRQPPDPPRGLSSSGSSSSGNGGGGGGCFIANTQAPLDRSESSAAWPAIFLILPAAAAWIVWRSRTKEK
jgi:hypothetical protein